MAKTDFTKKKPSGKSVDVYIESFPEEIQDILQNIRKTVQKAVPEAEEVFSYQMPAFKLNGMLIWYAAWKKHIGFYPRTAGMEDFFEKELSQYEGSKGTIKFPLDKPIPLDLISRIATYRATENLKKKKRKTL